MCSQHTIGLRCPQCGLEETVAQNEYGRCEPYKNSRFDVCSGRGADVIQIAKYRTSTTPGGAPQVIWEMQLCDTCMDGFSLDDEGSSRKRKNVPQQSGSPTSVKTRKIVRFKTDVQQSDSIQKAVHFQNSTQDSYQSEQSNPEETSNEREQESKQRKTMSAQSSNRDGKKPEKNRKEDKPSKKRPFGTGSMPGLENMIKRSFTKGRSDEWSDVSATPSGDEREQSKFIAARGLKLVEKEYHARKEREAQAAKRRAEDEQLQRVVDASRKP